MMADAGMICFPDAESDAVVRHRTWVGIDKNTFVGFKYHGNSIMACDALRRRVG